LFSVRRGQIIGSRILFPDLQAGKLLLRIRMLEIALLRFLDCFN